MATAKSKPGKGFPQRVHQEEGPLFDDVDYGAFVVFPERDGGKLATPIRTATAFAAPPPKTGAASASSGVAQSAAPVLPPEAARESGSSSSPGLNPSRDSGSGLNPNSGSGSGPGSSQSPTPGLSSSEDSDSSLSPNRASGSGLNPSSGSASGFSPNRDSSSRQGSGSGPSSGAEVHAGGKRGGAYRLPQAFLDSLEIVIDASSGISVEEQREILVHINGIAEKNRRALSAGAGGKKGYRKRFKAKKNGGRLPVLVNSCAILALVIGLIVLFALHDRTEIEAREGTRAFNDLERFIISEIRGQTRELLASKDLEIAILTAWLAEVEAQMELIAGHDVLTQEQMEDYEELSGRQAYLREALALAREERFRILNDSRSYEAVLNSQFNTRLRLETQMREFTDVGAEPPREQTDAYEQLLLQQEEFRRALLQTREERSVLLSEVRERETELQTQLAARNLVEAQLMELAAAGEAWTPAQQAAYERLIYQQTELRRALVRSWDERAQILDENRAREAEIQARLDARVHEFRYGVDVPVPAPALTPEVEAALDELAQLRVGQTQAERLENLIAGLFASTNRLVAENRLDDAGETLRSLRSVLYGPAFQDVHAVQSRREIYVQATDALETLLGRYRAANQTIDAMALQLRMYAEAGVRDEAPQIGVLPPGVVPDPETQNGPAQVGVLPPGVIPDPETQNGPAQIGILPPDAAPGAEAQNGAVQLALQQEVVRLTAELAAREYVINALRTHAETPALFVAQLENSIGALQTTNATLNTQMGNLQQANSALTAQVGSLQQTNSTLTTQRNNLQTANATLTAQVNSLQATNNTLQTTNASLNTQLGTLQTTNATLNTQTNNLNTRVNSLDSQVNTMRAELETQALAYENRRRETQTLQLEVQSLQASNANLRSLLSRLQQAVLDQ